VAALGAESAVYDCFVVLIYASATFLDCMDLHTAGMKHTVKWGMLKLKEWTMQEWAVTGDIAGVDFAVVDNGRVSRGDGQ